MPVSRAIAPTLLEAVHHPEVGLEVEAEVALAVDDQRCEPVREDVLAALRERHLRPLLPLGHRAADPHRLRLGLEDLAAEAYVRPDPRVEGQPVLTRPARVALDRRERIALLPARPKRRDELAEAVLAGDRAHSLDHRAAEAAALHGRADLDRERRERRRLAAVLPEAEAFGDDPVDTGRKTLGGPVPRERDC